jgi:hypothetical protein
MTGGINFKVDIKYVVTKWLNTPRNYTKTCTGTYIQKRTAWECNEFLMEHIPKTIAAFQCFYLAASNVLTYVTPTYTQTDTYPTDMTRKFIDKAQLMY